MAPGGGTLPIAVVSYVMNELLLTTLVNFILYPVYTP